MYKLLYLYQVPSHKQALKICWTQKGSNLDQKGQKWPGAKFFRTESSIFQKEDHKNSFYTKNHQNSMNHLDDMGIPLPQ